MKNFSQNSVKIALFGVVGSERVFKRVASTLLTLDSFPTSKICPANHSADGQIYGNRYPFPMLAPKLITYQIRKGREKQWFVDEEAAAVVKRIFDLCIGGNRLGILCRLWE